MTFQYTIKKTDFWARNSDIKVITTDTEVSFKEMENLYQGYEVIRFDILYKGKLI